ACGTLDHRSAAGAETPRLIRGRDGLDARRWVVEGVRPGMLRPIVVRDIAAQHPPVGETLGRTELYAIVGLPIIRPVSDDVIDRGINAWLQHVERHLACRNFLAINVGKGAAGGSTNDIVARTIEVALALMFLGPVFQHVGVTTIGI